MGLRFLNLSSNSRKQLKAFLCVSCIVRLCSQVIHPKCLIYHLKRFLDHKVAELFICTFMQIYIYTCVVIALTEVELGKGCKVHSCSTLSWLLVPPPPLMETEYKGVHAYPHVSALVTPEQCLRSHLFLGKFRKYGTTGNTVKAAADVCPKKL